jgi:NADH dehydrogenase
MIKPLKIVIIGNGFGGIYTLKNLHKFFHNDKNIKLVLVGEKNYFLFTPLLHEVATGGINPTNIIESIRKVLGCCLNEFYLGKVETINLKNQTVKIENNLIPYDYLVLAPGSKTNFYNILGAEKYSFPLKSIEDAIKIKNHCITQMERASHLADKTERKKMLKFVIVGGGPTGVELAAEMEELVKETFSRYYSKEIIEDVSITLIQGGKELVPQFGPKAREKSLQTLKKKSIEILLNTVVKEVGISYVVVNENTKIMTETIIWVAGIKPAEIKFSESVSQSPDGKLIVNEYLQLQNHKNIFALGDIALFKRDDSFLPALAQVAEKEAKIVAKNIWLLINNKNPEKFVYKNSGNLMSLGQWKAIGQFSNFTFSGHLAWFIWRTVYLSKLISFRKKVRVAVDWTMNLVSPRDISQL